MTEKVSILVIDDEPTVADALSLILSDSGYEVIVAFNGRDGLEKCDQRKFGITITDIRLPDISGLDVLSCIRGKDPDCLVLIITSHSTPEIVAESLSRGAIDVLPKPFLPSDILGLIDRALSKRAP
jgi:DNA-binding NtrC family response regulator